MNRVIFKLPNGDMFLVPEEETKGVAGELICSAAPVPVAVQQDDRGYYYRILLGSDGKKYRLYEDCSVSKTR